MEKSLLRRIAFCIYAIIFFAGLGFYIAWSATYSTWTDVGVYSVTVIMCGFGLLGMLLHSKWAQEPKE